METKPPSDAYNLLPRLAWLGLCEQYHQNQANRMVLEWSQAIDDAAKEYENSEGLKRRNADLVRMVDTLRSQLEATNTTSEERLAVIVSQYGASLDEPERSRSLLVEQGRQASSQLALERQDFEEDKRGAETSEEA
jgi:hypothetical protein